MAAWSGRRLHALAQWDFLSRPTAAGGSAPPFVEPPTTGGLPPEALAAVVEVLTAHTGTPDRCFIGVWEGYGWLDRSGPTWDGELALEQRTFLIRQGPIEGASGFGWAWPNGGFAQQPPALIWPADRAWFVAGDVDLDSTYVGGTAALITALLGHPGLEGWAVDAADDVSLGSDAINAP